MAAISVTTHHQHSQNAVEIPGLKHDEAGKLATVEAERLLTLMESLEGDDWTRPTDCSEWNVRDIVAHLAGAVASQASWAEFKRQNVANPYMKVVEMKIDAINQRQVEDRAEATHEELVAEFRENAPKSIRTRQRLPWLLRQLHVPLGPPLGYSSIGYMMDTIYTRDQWMHRHDISLATDRELVVTSEHDGRIMALVIRDVGRKLRGKLRGRRISLLLIGEAGGSFTFGTKGQPDAVIEVDTVTFNRLASGRIPTAAALDQAIIEGDRGVATWFLGQADVPY